MQLQADICRTFLPLNYTMTTFLIQVVENLEKWWVNIQRSLGGEGKFETSSEGVVNGGFCPVLHIGSERHFNRAMPHLLLH